MLKKLQYRAEALFARLFLGLFALLPLDAASGFGGWLARQIGPKLRAHRTAERNLRRSLPELTDTQVRTVLRMMWDNIGRVVGEYPHLQELATSPSRVEMVDPNGIATRLRADGIGAVLVTAHFGNWELAAVPGFRVGLNQANFYRAPNNPYVDALMKRLRGSLAPGGYLPKGHEGARRGLATLKAGGHVAMLVDQKQNEGLAIEFFGRPAMTTPAPAVFAQRLGLPIVAGRVERLKGANFRITIVDVPMAASGDRVADIAETTRRINTMFEDWIRARPELWFWVHRRWPD